MTHPCKRGELYYADLGKGVGSEQEGFRPVLILQNNTGNQYGTTTIIAPISSQITKKSILPTHFHIGINEGLTQPSIILLEQIRTISKRRLHTRIGSLTDTQIQHVDHCLAISIGLIQVPPRKLKIYLCQTCKNHLSSTEALASIQKLKESKHLCSYCSHHFGPEYEIVLFSFDE